MAKTFRYKHFYTNGSGGTPEAQYLNVAEIALNIAADGEKMFIKNTENQIVEFIPEHQIDAKINALDKDASAETGKIVTTISQADGKVSETKAYLKDIVLSGYTKDTSAEGAISDTDTVRTALSKLENKVGANKITNEDHSIVVTEPTGTATTTDVKVNIKSGEKVIKLDSNGIYTDIKLSAITPSGTNVKEEYALIASDGTTQLGTSIKVYKDSSLYTVYLGHVDDKLTNEDQSTHESPDTAVTNGTGSEALCFIYQLENGNYKLVAVDVESFLQESEFKDGLTADSSTHEVSVLIDSSSEKDSQSTPAAFLTVSASGVKLQGIKDEIDRKINALDVTSDAAVAGKYVAAIEETDGIVAVKSRENISEAVLNNYSKGIDATAVAASDTLNEAISKLENQIDVASTEVHKDVDATHLTLSSETNEFGATVYTIGENDIASATALSAETARAKAVEEALADSIDKLSAATEDAIEKERKRATSAETVLDRQIDAEVERANGAEADIRRNVAALSAATENEIERAISADTFLQEEIEELSGSVQNIVEGLDYTDSAVDDKYVTEVDETNGVISVQRDYISVLNLTTNGTPDFATGSTTNEIILEAGTF